ncbi:MarR family transcriptional regulator [Paenibacillus koleovorans]|uniref:MarR family transcriptional regulator n=1 Tax=Paenibacillus koleovorans TaxID=121608 RepID=UPI000FDC4CC3|nr:MarR family transcriptional regulator [Paenibacillus koleovorans]
MTALESGMSSGNRELGRVFEKELQREFQLAFERLLQEQRAEASGQRLEMLHRDLTGTRKLLEVAVWPALKSLQGIVLEKELVTSNGVKAYIDAFYTPLWFALEANGYVSHVETITRERYSFEQMKIRSIGGKRFVYLPFSWDELDKRPDACLRSFYEQLGQYGVNKRVEFMQLSVYEREVLRLLVSSPEAVLIQEIREVLQVCKPTCRKLLVQLHQKGLIRSVGGGEHRFHRFTIEEKGRELVLGR